MKTKGWEIELPYPWESLQVVLSEPEKTLPFFPYFESISGTKVRFKVPRFIFNFGYEFDLTVGFQEGRAVYTFTGDRGILTITFDMEGKRLRVTASWAGFGEAFMGKPLENFARGIAEAIGDFCSAQASCPVAKISGNEGVVEHITPETAPALIKRVSWELEGRDFLLEGKAEDGTRLSTEVRGGKLVRLVVEDPSGRRSVIESDVPVLELDGEVFRGLPLEKRFEVKVREL
jgi:hypothetical protein